ncbi:MAG: histidine--tRNA ligase [Candidatus Latescibacteria bacterium]|nr:histidine--tRNA ligase [Candidatus Latescibacterota bacterium]
MNKIQAIKGTNDILPGLVEMWQNVEEVVRKTMILYGYSEIRTPIFEETGLFARSIGEDTDIVGKEMYTFNDMGNRSITLRPEGTAAVVRAFIEHSLDQKGLPQKLWYMGPMFRQERPQKGRQRQFHQFGVEAIGSPSPMLDAEVMILFDAVCDKLGLDNRSISINSLGGTASRKAYREALVSFLDTVENQLCENCRRRKSTNPLRILDCKVPGCRDAIHHSEDLPHTIDYLTEEDRNNFETLLKFLDSGNVTYYCDYSLVRGLDYYTGTVFEMQYTDLGAQNAIMGGGRYDRLLYALGGPDLPAVGFACGIERLILALQNTKFMENTVKQKQVYIIHTDGNLHSRALQYLQRIRSIGVAADMDFLGKSMKAQMKAASRYGASFAMIVEPDDETVSVKDMEKSEQKTMPFNAFLSLLEKTNRDLNL